MTASRRNLVRARCILAQAWWLSLEIAAAGWTADAKLTVTQIAMAWRECNRPMGVE